MVSTAKADENPQTPEMLNIRGFIDNLLRRRSWLLAFIIIDILVAYAISTTNTLSDAWAFIIPGIGVTIEITVVAFVVALVLGLITALARISKNPILYNVATFYVELFRGLPLLVILLIFAFVITPALIDLIAAGPFDDVAQHLFAVNPDNIATTTIRTRDIDPVWRIMLAFAMTNGAFMSEVFPWHDVFSGHAAHHFAAGRS